MCIEDTMKGGNYLYNYDDPKESIETTDAEPEKSDLLPPWNPCLEKLFVKEQLKLSTKVEVEDVKAFCVGDAVVRPYFPFPSPPPTCKLLITQDICVKIPVKVSASISADKRDVTCCDKPYPVAESAQPSPCCN
jgi:hypothetical protein